MERYCSEKLATIRRDAYARMTRVQLFNPDAAIGKKKESDKKVRIQIREINMDEKMKRKWLQ